MPGFLPCIRVRECFVRAPQGGQPGPGPTRERDPANGLIAGNDRFAIGPVAGDDASESRHKFLLPPLEAEVTVQSTPGYLSTFILFKHPRAARDGICRRRRP